jgi:hypothetical protein
MLTNEPIRPVAHDLDRRWTRDKTSANGFRHQPQRRFEDRSTAPLCRRQRPHVPRRGVESTHPGTFSAPSKHLPSIRLHGEAANDTILTERAPITLWRHRGVSDALLPNVPRTFKKGRITASLSERRVRDFATPCINSGLPRSLLFVQTERGISVDDESFHKSGLEKPFYSLQLLSTGAEQYHFAIVEMLKIDSECPFIQIARNYLTVRIKEFAHAVANSSCPFEILQLNT